MKLCVECVDCSAKRTGKLLEGLADGKKIEKLAKKVRGAVKNNVGKKSPVILAKKRTGLIRKSLGILDASREKKDFGMGVAKKIVRDLHLPEGGFERFRRLVKLSIAANSLELDLPSHSAGLHGLEKKFMEELEAPLGLDESKGIYSRIKRSANILYLCDNAPELVFDMLLIGFIASMGKTVIPVVRGRFTQDDATPREARMLGLRDFVTTGSSATGVVYSDVTKKLQKLLRGSDFVIAKGMGNFEGLTEDPGLIDGRVAFLFKVKCIPVSRAVGVPKGSGVAFIYRKGTRIIAEGMEERPYAAVSCGRELSF